MGGLGVFVEREDSVCFVVVDTTTLAMPMHSHNLFLTFDPKVFGGESSPNKHVTFRDPSGRGWAGWPVDRCVLRFFAGGKEISSKMSTHLDSLYALAKADPGYETLKAGCLLTPPGPKCPVRARAVLKAGIVQATQLSPPCEVTPDYIGGALEGQFATIVSATFMTKEPCVEVRAYPFDTKDKAAVLTLGGGDIQLSLTHYPPMPESNRHVAAYYDLGVKQRAPLDRCWPKPKVSTLANPCAAGGPRGDCIPGKLEA